MTRYQKSLALIFSLAWVWSALAPLDRGAWLLENLLLFIFVPVILLVARYFKFSSLSYTLITLFFIMHVIGSHYTYSQVPFGYTLQEWFNQGRNMYDRLVHFSFGFLLAYPIREALIRISKARGFWAYYLPLDLVVAFSAVYEILEWLAARSVAKFDPHAALAFLGQQGDVWDAQKDMFMAGTGALLAMLLIFLLNWRYDRRHWRDFKASWKLDVDEKPLGEEVIKEYLK